MIFIVFCAKFFSNHYWEKKDRSYAFIRIYLAWGDSGEQCGPWASLGFLTLDRLWTDECLRFSRLFSALVDDVQLKFDRWLCHE
jgi:hypothetical protein